MGIMLLRHAGHKWRSYPWQSVGTAKHLLERREKTVNVENTIREKLLAAFAPSELEIQNDSGRHAHHVASHGVPATGETHFTVIMVSDKFQGVSRVERHRMVNQALAAELAGPVHALALKLSAPGE